MKEPLSVTLSVKDAEGTVHLEVTYPNLTEKAEIGILRVVVNSLLDASDSRLGADASAKSK